MSWFCCQSSILSGLVNGEHSSTSKARRMLFQSQAPTEKRGSPKLVACPTAWCFWPAQNWPKSVPTGRAAHRLGAAAASVQRSWPVLQRQVMEVNAFSHAHFHWCVLPSQKVRASRWEMQIKGCQYRCLSTCTAEHALSPTLLLSHHYREWVFLL